jgi:hypothetical protein
LKVCPISKYIFPEPLCFLLIVFPIRPDSNIELLITDECLTHMGVNARTYNPVTIESTGNVKYTSPNANYHMTGARGCVNLDFFQRDLNWIILALGTHSLSHLKNPRHIITYVFYIHG